MNRILDDVDDDDRRTTVLWLCKTKQQTNRILPAVH